MHRRQRCLLSSPTDCLISSTRRSTSARMAFSDLRRVPAMDSVVGGCSGTGRKVQICYQSPPVPGRMMEPASGGANRRAAAVGVGDPDHAVIIRRRGAGLEGFREWSAFARAAPHAGLGVDADQLDAGGHLERNRRLVGERELEEVLDDRRGEMAAGGALAEIARLVVADIDADREVRREADEPGVLFVVGGSGLAGDRLADFLQDRRGTAPAPRLPSSR